MKENILTLLRVIFDIRTNFEGVYNSMLYKSYFNFEIVISVVLLEVPYYHGMI